MALDLIPTDSHDGVGPLEGHARYETYSTWEELVWNAPSAMGECLTYRSKVSGRWVLKYIYYIVPDDIGAVAPVSTLP